MKSVDYPIVGFTGHLIHPKGLIPLPVLIREGENSRHLEANFLVVDVTSANKAIIGRLLIHQAWAVVSVYHLTVLYVSDQGIAEILRGNQYMARECYIMTLHSSRIAYTSKGQANGLNPKKMRRVVECGHVGMATLDAREEFVPTTKSN